MSKSKEFKFEPYKFPLLTSRIDEIEAAFDFEVLQRVCEMHEEEFAEAYDLVVTPVNQKPPSDFYAFRDNGSNVLAVAHLDTVGLHWERFCQLLETAGGPVVYSRALDDRLGAYIILELLPALGINHDILLTVGEEDGRSTAAFFESQKNYEWMIEFDRGGTDVVMYQYEDDETVDMVKAAGARVGDGSFSDISYLEHLEIKGFNWGVGYQDYHGPRAHAYLDDTFSMVNKYLRFHENNDGIYMPHEPDLNWGRGWGSLLAADPYSDPFDDDDLEADLIDLDEADYIEHPTQEDHEALERALERYTPPV